MANPEWTEPQEWSGSPDPLDPDNFWIDDDTGERVCAYTGERFPARPCHCGEPMRANLDGDDLCQAHADAWVRAEGQAAAESASA